MINLTSDQVQEISELPFLRNTEYYNLDFQKTLEYIIKRYIQPLNEHLDLSTSTLVDCGAGFGWLAFGFLLSGGKHATLCDIDEPRLKDAERIAEILNIKDKCDFIAAPMQELPFHENQFDIFVSVETLEHVGDPHIDACIELISKSTDKLVILTTPNKFFPLVLHDNKIPMSHWIPSSKRSLYTNLFGVKGKPENDFVSPLRLKPLRQKFAPVSTTLTFKSYKDWKSSYPFYSPYNYSNRWKDKAPFFLRCVYFSLAKIFGKNSYYFSPNLCRIWLKK
tara:strand:+ start:54228 stop:55064 length:837 start_codon:yes stop_codon:yes gene_type:complete